MQTTAEQPDVTKKIQQEIERAKARRVGLKLARPAGHEEIPWALCLSGGGIRSATFCLGVLQGMARTPAPGSPTTGDSDHSDWHSSLLPQFDCLSTVSGGGYVGGFFSALFVKGRLSGNKSEKDKDAAERAYRVLLDEPPERMHTTTVYDSTRPGHAALAWLRDNGRYLAPTGSGDMIYAGAVALRNWLATHYVVATVSLLVLALALLLRLALTFVPGFVALETLFCRDCGDLVRWSSSWYLAGALLLLVSVPFGIGFWFTHPAQKETVASKPKAFTTASVTAMILGVLLSAAGYWAWHSTVPPTPTWSKTLLVGGGLTLLGVAYFVLVKWLTEPATITAHRVEMTQALSMSLMLVLGIAGLATAETVALTAALWWEQRHLLPAGSIVAVAVWLIRFVAQRVEAKQPGMAQKAKVPLSMLAGVLGVALWLLVAGLLALLLLWIVSDGSPDYGAVFMPEGALASLPVAAWALLVVLAIAWLSGQFPGFLNLSTLQGLYSARLTRAYLGASNYERFREASGRKHSVAEPVPHDNVEVDELYANTLAPIHFVNVCVNQTAGPDGQLVQRDRKGKPFMLAPHGFYIDGVAYRLPDSMRGSSELHARLTLGEWIGVSGAAFTTGLGRSTSLGTSLLLGFANMRLGRWWASGAQDKAALRRSIARRIFKTQTYLLDEIRAVFHGTRLPYQYLSDGGHFENTAAYEMLRPERRVKLLVVCDCGADPDYGFDDLANLIRLARIDHSVEIRVNTEVTQHSSLQRVFATPAAFIRKPTGELPVPSDHCAVLLDVFGRDSRKEANGSNVLVARIILLKPVMIAGVETDVLNYHVQHPAFPQEPTGDQFFDEAQWESYRKLGLEVARRVFPQKKDSEYAKAFWRAVLVGAHEAPRES
jgi:hypothetical protein